MKHIRILLLTSIFAISFCSKENNLDEENSIQDSAPSAEILLSQDGGVTRVAEVAASDSDQTAKEDSYVISLATKPEATVSIMLSFDNEQVNVSPAVVNLTRTNYNQGVQVTVTSIDDNKLEGPHYSLIRHRVAAGPSEYRSVIVPDISVEIADNDSASVIVNEGGKNLTVSESGMATSYSIRLGTAPGDDVLLEVSTLSNDITIAPNSQMLHFNQLNYNIPQNVVVVAVDDTGLETTFNQEGERIEETALISHTLTSPDNHYDSFANPAITPADVTISVLDNDTIVYVRKAASGDGSSWAQAYPDLLTATQNLSPGQRIWVTADLYTVDDDDINAVLLLNKDNTGISGRFSGDEHSMAERDLKISNNPNHPHTIITGSTPAGTSKRLIKLNEASNIHLDNLILRNSGDDNSHGGGLRADLVNMLQLKNIVFENIRGYSGGAAHIRDCSQVNIISSTFKNNFATYQAGALYLAQSSDLVISQSLFSDNSTPNDNGNQYAGGIMTTGIVNLTIEHSTFNDNTGAFGGSIFISGSDITIFNNTFTGNESITKGGAVHMNGGQGHKVIRNVFLKNHAKEEGGAISLRSDAEVIGNRFQENSTDTRGGALQLGDGGYNNRVSLIGNEFLLNSSGTTGGAIYNGGQLEIYHSSFENNTSNSGGGAIYTDTNLTVHSSFFNANSSVNYSGGAIEQYNGTMAIYDSHFLANHGISGGAIWLQNNTEALIKNSTLENNVARNKHGGGIRTTSAGITLTIEDSIIKGNQASVGGFIHMQTTAFTMRRTQLIENRANSHGGAIYAHKANNVVIEDSSFVQNAAQGNAGAINIFQGDQWYFERTRFEGNESQAKGGAVYSESSNHVSYSNSIFTANKAHEAGAVYNYAGCYNATYPYTFRNSVIAKNQAEIHGGVRFQRQSGCNNYTEIIGLNSIFWGNTLTDGSNSAETNFSVRSTALIIGPCDTTSVVKESDCHIQGHMAQGPTFHQDPMFRDFVVGDFRLLPGSPLIDHADNHSLTGLDFLGAERTFAVNTDRGAYEHHLLTASHEEIAIAEGGTASNFIQLSDDPGQVLTYTLEYDRTALRITDSNGNALSTINLDASHVNQIFEIQVTARQNCQWQPGAHRYQVKFTGQSAAPFDVVAGSFFVTVADDDTSDQACLRLAATEGETVVNQNSSDLMMVGLSKEPASEVTVTLTTTGNALIESQPVMEIVFTPENWQSRPLVVTALTNTQPGVAYISYQLASSDEEFNALPVNDSLVVIEP